jgi:hypothetical protein
MKIAFKQPSLLGLAWLYVCYVVIATITVLAITVGDDILIFPTWQGWRLRRLEVIDFL